MCGPQPRFPLGQKLSSRVQDSGQTTGISKAHAQTGKMCFILKRWLYMWTSPDGQYQNQIDYILCNPKWRRSIRSAKTRLGADCGSDLELLIAKFRLKLKKVAKTTRAFRYDLNQVPYDYTVEVASSFKGLDLIDRVPEELPTKIFNTVQETVTKTIPKRNKCKKANRCLRSPYK